MLVRRHRADDSVTKAVQVILTARLIVVDDIGLLPVSPDAAEGFFRLVDGTGAPFAASGAATVLVAVASGQEPPSLRLGIGGRR